MSTMKQLTKKKKKKQTHHKKNDGFLYMLTHICRAYDQPICTLRILVFIYVFRVNR